MEKQFCVYSLASGRDGTLHTGVTSNLIKGIWQRKNNEVEGFTKKYAVHDLVWFEQHESAESAITREKQIKEWKRKWKLELIEKSNPDWLDLYDEVCGATTERHAGESRHPVGVEQGGHPWRDHSYQNEAPARPSVAGRSAGWMSTGHPPVPASPGFRRMTKRRSKE